MKTNRERFLELDPEKVLSKCFNQFEPSTKSKFVIDDLFHSSAAIELTHKWIDKFASHPRVELFNFLDLEKEFEANLSLELLSMCRELITSAQEGSDYYTLRGNYRLRAHT